MGSSVKQDGACEMCLSLEEISRAVQNTARSSRALSRRFKRAKPLYTLPYCDVKSSFNTLTLKSADEAIAKSEVCNNATVGPLPKQHATSGQIVTASPSFTRGKPDRSQACSRPDKFDG